MTAVLSFSDAFRRECLSQDTSPYPSSATEWRAKYQEVADMLAETRAELDDFQQSSKELEEELEAELERTEKAQKDLLVKASKAESERDEWKAKFVSLQTQHNTTVASLQRELDQLRQEHQKVKIQLRELELGNDDLERNERAISSSLQDTEAKYSRALEEKILLEHELLDKANVEAESQRLRDELRDANEEVAILKEKLSQRASRFSVASAEGSIKPASTPSTSTHPSDEDLLRTAPPPGLKLSELSSEVAATPTSRPRPTSLNSTHSSFLQRTPRSHLSTPPAALSSALTRSTTIPNLSPTPKRLKPPTPRPITARNISMASTTSSKSAATTTSRSKGVQMVSEMRAKVKNLEQRIHTRVPRLRMGSLSKATAPPMAPSDTMTNISGSSAGYSEDLESTVVTRRSAGSPEHRKPAGDSGWVLIMEDSPMKDTARETRSSRESRRDSNPFSASYRAPPSSFSTSPTSITSTRSSSGLNQSAMPSVVRRPQSRLSSDGRTSTSTASSIPTSASRPSTPTFLPIASAHLYNSTGGKRSVGPSPAPQISGPQPKRGPVGSTSSTNTPSPSMLPPSQLLKFKPKSKLPSLNPLGQSRMGKPSGRRSTGPESLNVETLTALDLGRSRSGSTSAAYLKNKDRI
ncbi:hypothetical protein BJ322DRAFT_702101 [Thelephora terrestris]|uniref:NUDE domain-containing protein n=1 Tax=Thelephora terrestris TaxID=56493 RepID=A0A9P6HH80_9AGAM|nr:hypothetical protein BJ322DRAFT_702101 [Thelephora terrestris]